MMTEAKIVKELADRLVLLGLKRGDCRIEDDKLGERCCSVARWKIGKGVNIDVYCYFGEYFGSPHVWVGFGSPVADRITTVMAGINRKAYAAIVDDDWDYDLQIMDTRKMAELRRKNFTSFEDYTDLSNYWAWFGQYFRMSEDVASKAMPLLGLVIQLHRSRQPATTSAHVGPTEARRMTKVRIGQDKFREAVMNRWGSVCAVTIARSRPR